MTCTQMQQPKRGVYVCLEGVKGVGKSTVLSDVKAAYRAQGVAFAEACPTKSIANPHPPDHLLEYLSSRIPSLRSEDEWNEALYAERSRHVARTVDWSSPLIIGDRSVVTSYVTRWQKYGSAQQTIDRVDQYESEIPAPNVVIELRLSVDVLLKRLQNRERFYGKHDETVERLHEQLAAYDDIYAYLKNRHAGERSDVFTMPRLAHTQWHRVEVDPAQTPAQVSRGILDIVEQYR